MLTLKHRLAHRVQPLFHFGIVNTRRFITQLKCAFIIRKRLFHALGCRTFIQRTTEHRDFVELLTCKSEPVFDLGIERGFTLKVHRRVQHGTGRRDNHPIDRGNSHGLV